MSSNHAPNALNQRSFLQRAHITFAALGGVYILLVALLAVPFFQRHIVYLNAISLPWRANFDSPARYGLAPNKTYNIHIAAPDNETLGTWYILSDRYYHHLPFPADHSPAHIAQSIKEHPTILFLHGNAATRAFHVRVQHYTTLGARLGANILALDYRGFGDSTGTPSEDGLALDARAAWDWLAAQGAKAEDVLIMGHSLGTGVSGRLAATLSSEGVHYKGVVLMSPFSSINELLRTYLILGVVPLMKPLTMIPFAPGFVSWALAHKYDTLRYVPNITGEVVIAHAENDWDIPYTHSEVLFDAFLDPYLPYIDHTIDASMSSLSQEQWSAFMAELEARRTKKAELVSTISLPNFGEIQEFKEEKRSVTFVKMLQGRHDYVGVQEGLQDVIGRKFKFL